MIIIKQASVRRILGGLYALILIGALCATVTVSAQSITPAQLEQLRQLTPEQRQAVIRALSDLGDSTIGPPSGSATPEIVEVIAPPVETETDEQRANTLKSLDTLVISLQAPDDIRVLHNGLRAAQGSRVYRLNDDGEVELPQIGRVPVAGLTADEVVLRLQSEPLLEGYDITASLLPVTPDEVDRLKPYGYDLFSGSASSFTPSAQLPVPKNYTVGVGDTVNVQTFGNENNTWTLAVDREGRIVLPGLGPVTVAGMSFDQLQQDLKTRIEQQAIGVNALVTLGELRSIQIFVVGDVKRPGAYTVSGLSTMTNALFVGGGLLESGSMRNVQLKRNNRLVSTLDLYDLLMRGNTKDDRRLKSGDVVFVPPVGERVSVMGQVLRPAVYEFKGERSVKEVMRMAGGLLPSAYQRAANVYRFNADGRKSILTLNLKSDQLQQLQGGDVFDAVSVKDDIDNGVNLQGHVLRPGSRMWFQGMRLSDVISSASELKSQADLNYVLIHRLQGPGQLSQLFSGNLRAALQSPASDANVGLMPQDTITVFSLGSDRAERIRPWLERVSEQAGLDNKNKIVTISGQVRAPGKYPLETGMRVSDLVRAAGGLLESAYLGEAEMTRQTIEFGGEQQVSEHIKFNIKRALQRFQEDDMQLTAYDFVSIREISKWREQQTIEITGEVKFPGTYTLRPGEFLSEVVNRAGGLSDTAFPEGSVFLRTDLREREQEQLDRLVDRVSREVNVMNSQSANNSKANAEQLLAQLSNTKAQGRLVIDLSRLLAHPADSHVDVLVKAEDKLFVPSRSQEVTVIGEVQYPTSHLYTSTIGVRDYLQKSGGLTSNADRKRIYVVRANGEVIASSGSAWFARSQGFGKVMPGDTIVVPLDADKIGTLSLWTSVTQIIYNIGVAAAAVASF